MDFSSIAGNRDVLETLSDELRTHRFPHAILLQGEAGTGKRTLAKLLAGILVCENREHAPCGVCPACIRARAGSHPDIRIPQGSGKTNSLSVDTIKGITADAYKMPDLADVSIYLLFVENRMSEAVQNKLLKLMEEPPGSAVFILTAPSAEQFLPTIRSRVQIFTMRAPALEDAAAFVGEKAGIPPEEANRLAVLCSGNVGRMLEELADGNAQAVQQTAQTITKNLLINAEHGLLEASAPMIRDKHFAGQVLARLSLIIRDACVLRSQGTALLGGADREAQDLCRLSMKRLLALAQIPEKYRRMLDQNVNMTLLVTGLCAAMRTAAGK